MPAASMRTPWLLAELLADLGALDVYVLPDPGGHAVDRGP